MPTANKRHTHLNSINAGDCSEAEGTFIGANPIMDTVTSEATSETRREMIIGAACNAIGTQGLRGTAVCGIAAVGVAMGTVTYYFFGSAEVLQVEMTERSDAVMFAADEAPTGLAVLRMLTDGLLTSGERAVQYSKKCLGPGTFAARPEPYTQWQLREYHDLHGLAGRLLGHRADRMLDNPVRQAVEYTAMMDSKGICTAIGWARAAPCSKTESSIAFIYGRLRFAGLPVLPGTSDPARQSWMNPARASDRVSISEHIVAADMNADRRQGLGRWATQYRAGQAREPRAVARAVQRVASVGHGAALVRTNRRECGDGVLGGAHNERGDLVDGDGYDAAHR